jgi:hypothetical protein
VLSRQTVADERLAGAEGTEAPASAAAARPAARLRPGLIAALAFLAPALLFVFSRAFFVPVDPDYWWHARTGQYILDTRSLPRVDIYSSTAAGTPWTTHEWLTEIGFALGERAFGYAGNVALFGLLGALTAAAVYATCRRRGVGEPGATLLTLWAVMMGLPLANVRPQMITALLVAVTALLLTRYRQGDPSTPLRAAALWPLPPLLALWVNLHGGYVMGLVLIGLTVVGEAIARRRGHEGGAAPLRPLLVVAVLSGLATLLSPHGLEALRYPFTYAGTGNASQRFIAEWQSPDFHSPFILIFGAGLLLALLLGLGRRPLGPTDTLWAVTVTLMALQSTRHIPLWAIVATPLLGARLAAEYPRQRGTLAEWRAPALALAAVSNWTLVALSIAGTLALAGAGARDYLRAEPPAATYPAGVVAYLRANELDGAIFNEYHWGGYLIYQLYPRYQVFIDGRADVYGDALVTRYRNTTRLAPGWRDLLVEHDVRLVLLGKNSALAAALLEDSNWETLYTGEIETLLRRRTP